MKGRSILLAGFLVLLGGGIYGCGPSCEEVCNAMTSYPFDWPEPSAQCAANCESDAMGYSCIRDCSPAVPSKEFYTCICVSCSEAFCADMI